MYARVVEGEIQETAEVVPYGEFADGSTVSGPLIEWSDDDLRDVGWLPVIDDGPPKLESWQSVTTDYSVEKNAVVATYTVTGNKPVPPAPQSQVITDHADKAQAVLDGTASFTKAESDQILAAFVRQNTPQEATNG